MRTSTPPGLSTSRSDDTRQEAGKVPTSRIAVLQVAVVVGFLLLAGTFWFFQIIQHEQFREMAENNHQRELALRAPRGVLYDRNGKILVENRPSYTVSIVRLHTTNLDRTIRVLAAVAGVEERRVREIVDRGTAPAVLSPDRRDPGRDAGAGGGDHGAPARFRAARRGRRARADAALSDRRDGRAPARLRRARPPMRS